MNIVKASVLTGHHWENGNARRMALLRTAYRTAEPEKVYQAIIQTRSAA